MTTRKPIPFSAKLRYSFENTLSKGPVAIIGWLALASLAVVLFAAIVMAIFRVGYGDNVSFLENLWNSLMRTFDAGNMADDGAGDEGSAPNWIVRIVALMVTLGGIFIISTLIGALTSGIEGKLDELRKGRSPVLESDHTLILGWSPKVFAIISELIIANESAHKPSIVILADRDKVEMEDELATRFPTTKNTRIICRRGSALDLDELAIANPHEARSIIVLAPEVEHPDIYVVKSILALTNNPNRRPEPYHIVAEIREDDNLEAARLVGGDETVLVQPSDLIARVTAQTCRQSGLSVVYTELLDFDGAEIYFSDQPALNGKTYRDVLVAFDDCTVMGVYTVFGDAFINPSMDRVMATGDQVILIAEDDSAIRLRGGSASPADVSAIREAGAKTRNPERTLILGWNDKAIPIIRELDEFVDEGSSVCVVANCPLPELPPVQRQTLTSRQANATERAVLDSLDVLSFDHIIVLCYSDLDVQEADANTLVTLLHLRNIAEESGRDLNVVSEMLDVRNRALAEVARADDFIVSDKLVSLMLSQLSENKHLAKVFATLFTADGSEIYLRPMEDYVELGRPVDFYTLIESAARRGETALGYRIAADASKSDKGYGVNCNPKKSDRLTFVAGDKIMVLAEE